MKKNKTYTKKQAETIIDKSMIAFGLSYEMKTDPQIMKSVVEELKLDDFKTKNKRIAKFFKDVISKPQKLQPMFENIKKGIVSKHPAVIEFSELALKKRWFNQSEHIVRSVHVMYILEALTATMCNSHDFFIEAYDYHKTKELKCGIDFKYRLRGFMRVLGIFHNLFETIKYFSINPAMIYFRTQRGFTKSHREDDKINKLLKDKKISYLEYKLLLPIHKNGLVYANELLRINICEAGIAEYQKGLKANAVYAYELSEDIRKNPPHTTFKKKDIMPENHTNTFYGLIAHKENLFPVAEFSQDWVSLYTAWNMAFVLGNLDDLDMIFPMLLIPSVIDAERGNFLGVRTISLWLIAKYLFFRKYNKKEVIGLKNKIKMSQAWAKINKKYAFYLAKRELHEDSKELMRSYRRFFSQPFYNLFKLARVFID
jgi:hypothetical protein